MGVAHIGCIDSIFQDASPRVSFDIVVAASTEFNCLYDFDLINELNGSATDITVNGVN